VYVETGSKQKIKIPAQAQGFLFAQRVVYRMNKWDVPAAGLDEFSLYGKVSQEDVGAVQYCQIVIGADRNMAA